MPNKNQLKSSRAVQNSAKGKVHGRLVVFFSFDLVNSTRYKGVNKLGWPVVIRRFYDAVVDGMKKWLGGFSVWKYVGDEVLLYYMPNSTRELRQCITAAARVIKSTTDAVHQDFRNTRTLISVKGTIWCARVLWSKGPRLPRSTLANTSNHPTNLAFRAITNGSEQVDFLGPDIDVGFRLGKFSARGRLVVSADLAYLLYRNRTDDANIENQLNIVAFESLKGIWEERMYPIVWFEEDWVNIRQSFVYDEHHSSDIIQAIRNAGTPIGKVNELAKIFLDNDVLETIDKVWDDLKGGGFAVVNEKEFPIVAGRSGIEVHCVALCFRDDGRILAARRPADKKRYPGLWEFGCGQLLEGESFADCLKRNYKSDFNLLLEIDVDPHPVQSYVIDDAVNGYRIPGIVFLARVMNPNDAKATKHAELDWIDPTIPPDNIDTGFVPFSKRRLQLALAAKAVLNSIPRQ